jgi:alkylation response protein AidB-like acyl-CoA dehydrogenase
MDSHDVWQAMAGIGLLGLPFPAHGGFGGGAMDAISVIEAIGDALIVEPWLATVALGAQLVARGGSEEQRQKMLPAVAQGLLKLAFAYAEPGTRYTLAHVTARARADDVGYVITGVKQAVPHAAAADTLVVSVRTGGRDTDPDGISLLLVPRNASGLTIRPLHMLDGTRAADVVLDDVRVPAAALVGAPGRALPLIEDVVDFATALVCAEAAGAIRSANEATLDYLKTRKQFGVAIGSFRRCNTGWSTC